MSPTSTQQFYTTKVNQALNVLKLFFPQKANSMPPTALDIECLSAFPFFHDDFITILKSELPTRLSKCADTHESFCPLQ